MSDHLYSNGMSKIGQIYRSYTRMRHIYDQLYHFRAAVLGILKKTLAKSLKTPMKPISKPKLKLQENQFNLLL